VTDWTLLNVGLPPTRAADAPMPRRHGAITSAGLQQENCRAGILESPNFGLIQKMGIDKIVWIAIQLRQSCRGDL
jgi:hypothetical protein